MISKIRSLAAVLGLMLVVAGMAGTAIAGPLPPDVPELDPSSIGSAVTLATGALFVLRGRRAAK